MSDMRQERAVRAAEKTLISLVFRGNGRVPSVADLNSLFRKLWQVGYDAGVDDEANGRNPKAKPNPAMDAALLDYVTRGLSDSPISRIMQNIVTTPYLDFDKVIHKFDVTAQAVAFMPDLKAESSGMDWHRRGQDRQIPKESLGENTKPVTDCIPKPGRTVDGRRLDIQHSPTSIPESDNGPVPESGAGTSHL